MKCNFEKNRELSLMHAQEGYFNGAKMSAIKGAKTIFGKDIFDTIFLPKDFNLSKLDTFEGTRHKNMQECKLPFDDKTIQDAIFMPKKMLDKIFCYVDRGKLIHGAFLVGKQDDKFALFLLKIVKDCQNPDFSDVSIKLDLCVQGRAWLNLLRLDTMGNYHPNYVVNGKVIQKQSEMTYARPPHLHNYDFYTQVVASNHKYMIAKELPFFDYEKDSVSDKFMFKKFVNYFLDYTNTSADINKVLTNNYHFTQKQPLFLNTNAIKANKVKDLDGVEF